MGVKNLYRQDVKQAGKKQAMTNTFLRLHTRPEEYDADPVCSGYDHSHCDLCGNKIDYSFKLTHPKDPDFKNGRSLMVGSDCIIHFAEIYLPTRLNQFLAKVKASTEETKSKKFKRDNPTIFEDAKKLEEFLKSLDRAFPWNPAKRLSKTQEFYKNKRHLIRHQYLSKPKVESIKELIEESKHWPLFLQQWQDRVQLKKGMPVESQSHDPIYAAEKIYGAALNFPKTEGLAYTPLEVELFWDQLNLLTKEKTKRKKAFEACILKYGRLYERAFNKGPDFFLWGWLVAFKPLSYYQLRTLLEGEEKASDVDGFGGPMEITHELALKVCADLDSSLYLRKSI